MAKQTIRMRCMSVADTEQEIIAEDANAAPLVGIVRKIRLVEARPGRFARDSFALIELEPDDAKWFEVGGEYDVTVSTVPKSRAPRR
jgi:hypothetical protein